MKTSKIAPSLFTQKIYVLENDQKENQLSDTKCQNDTEGPRSRCRYIVVFIGFFIFFLVNGYRMNMSVAIVAMVNKTGISLQTKTVSESCSHLIPNTTTEDDFIKNSREEGQFAWSPRIQGCILGSYVFGYAISQLPAGRLSERFGCKWILFGSSFVTAVCTFLIPVFSWPNASVLIVLLTLRGLTQGFVQPASAVLAANWFPRLERGFLFIIVKSGAAFGSFAGSLFSGFLCASLGRWPSSFYAFGAAGIAVSAMILFFIHESPEDHPKISKAELDYILSNQECELSKRRPRAPWLKILTSVPTYALMYACFGQLWATSQFLTVHATFLGTILHYPIAKNGFFSSLPFLIQFISAQLGGWLTSYMQRKNFASINCIRKFWTLLATSGASACLLGIYFAGCDRNLSIIFGILSMGFCGFAYAGCFIVSFDMTPKFAGSFNALCTTFGCTSGVFLPLVVGYLTNEMQTIEQWNKVFFISIGIIMSSGIAFAGFGSAEVQPWNFVEDEKVKEGKEVDKTQI